MCGIIGYVGERPCGDLLLNGLEKLEYRGYDSAGLSLLVDGHFESVHSVGNLSQLREAINLNGTKPAMEQAKTGLGHTRWATHGKPSLENAHPHTDCDGQVHVVVNGIIENFAVLRRELESEGCHFSSETDAEVVAHLVKSHLDKNPQAGLVEAVRGTYALLDGHYAFCVASSAEPGLIVGARKECPLVVGVGDGEHFVASAIPAFLRETRRVQIVENDEIVEIYPDRARFTTPDGKELEREVEEITWSEDAAEKSGFESFMLKEIHEQPYALAETIADRLVRPDCVELGDFGVSDAELKELKRVIVVACGTSYHAGVVGRYAIEQWARLPIEMDIASEYRYRNPVIGPGDLLIGITQSGETADTLAAMRLAKERGAKVITITNVVGSQATRDADGVLYSRAGLEIGVAATKTFIAQVAVMYLIGLKIAELRGTLSEEVLRRLIAELRNMPQQMGRIITATDKQMREIAERYYQCEFFLYLGRHIGLPIALEGALKLKEISYIPTEAYAAGEMKHGPIALLSDQTPVVCVATDSPVLDKVLSNVAEVKARGARVIAVATEGEVLGAEIDEVVTVPRTDWLLQPLLAVVPLQLLAYHIAILKGLNVDQPRNLAKTVTVE